MLHPGTCTFYNGFIGRAGEPEPRRCKAGVCYEQEFGKHAVRAPCIEYMVKSKNGGTVLKPGEIGIRTPWGGPGRPLPLPCSRRVEPTDDEVQQDAIEHEAEWEKFVAAMRVVSKWRTWTKKNRVAKQEVIECPTCKGRLHLSQAAYNGHVHGKCETDGCLSWME